MKIRLSLIFGITLSLLAIVGLALSAPLTARADPGIIRVDADAPCSTCDGLSWTTAYTNV
jgi:hypothetical protein